MLRELVLVGVVYLGYRAGRLLTADSAASAYHNADLVHRLEGSLGLPSESAIQSAVRSMAGSTQLFEAANLYYVTVHFPLTVTFLLWGFFARPRAEYRWARNLLIFQTMAAVLIHVAFPLAPPRMFPEWDFVDTAALYGPSAYQGASAAVANQYAAMPSLHVGWAVLIAVVVSRTGPRALRHLAWLNALATLAVVIVTANHWFVDALVAVALLAAALAVFRSPGDTRVPRAREVESRADRVPFAGSAPGTIQTPARTT